MFYHLKCPSICLNWKWLKIRIKGGNKYSGGCAVFVFVCFSLGITDEHLFCTLPALIFNMNSIFMNDEIFNLTMFISNQWRVQWHKTYSSVLCPNNVYIQKSLHAKRLVIHLLLSMFFLNRSGKRHSGTAVDSGIEYPLFGNIWLQNLLFGCKTYHTESKLPIHSGWEFEQPGLAGGARAYNKGVGN